MADKIDVSLTGVYLAEEETAKTLPTTPVWFEQEPDELPDVGSDYSYVARNPINAGRQDKKGAVVDVEVKFAIKNDVTQNNTIRKSQGFLWADAREKFDTQSLGSASITITGVDGVNDEYEAASGLDDAIVNNIVFGTDFGETGNNGIKVVAAAAAGAIETVESLTAEASPPSTARVQVVGYQFPSGDLNMVAGTNTCTLTTSATDCTTIGFNVGEWTWIGGDTAATTLVSNVGYARISSVTTNAIVCDCTTFTPANETGTGLTVQMFFSKFIRNEAAADIVRRTYQAELQVGSDDDGVQSMCLTGCVPNEETIEIPKAEKVSQSETYVGMGIEYRTGSDGIKTGTRVLSLGEEFYNTSSDLYASKLYVRGTSTTNETSLFGYLHEATITTKNNVSRNQALGVVGAFDCSSGNIQCGMTAKAYFTLMSQLQAVANSSDMGAFTILARENGGIIFDLPLGGIKGKLELPKDGTADVPIEFMAAENGNGYTMSKTFFAYLPDAAMPA